jgi:hypothetical protein
MLTAFWLIGWPALVIADRALATGFFPSGLKLEDDAFLISYFASFTFFLYVDWMRDRPRQRRAEAVLSEEDQLRLRNITSAYNTVARTVNDNTATIERQFKSITAKVDQQQKLDGDFKLAATNAVAAFDIWTSNVPELPSSRHAFERAIHRLRQEVQRTK